MNSGNFLTISAIAEQTKLSRANIHRILKEKNWLAQCHVVQGSGTRSTLILVPPHLFAEYKKDEAKSAGGRKGGLLKHNNSLKNKKK